jgi:hypothetical protein
MSATRWYIRADLLNILRFTSFCFHHTHLPLAAISNRFARQVSDEWYNIDCPRAARVAESPHSNRRQRHHHLRARHDSNCRFRRCSGGLLSRQFGQDRAAGGHRRDRVDAVKNAATETSSQLQTQATTYLTALFTRPEATGLTVNATYTSSGGSQVVVTSSANVRSAFMNLVGVSSMKVAADSQVKWGSSRLRVALVLDNTGSMADDGKISALITATNNLLTQLKNAVVNPGDVYVSIIPFVKDVNVGSATTRRPGSTGQTGTPTTDRAATRTIATASPTARRTARPGPRPTTTPGTAA